MRDGAGSWAMLGNTGCITDVVEPAMVAGHVNSAGSWSVSVCDGHVKVNYFEPFDALAGEYDSFSHDFPRAEFRRGLQHLAERPNDTYRISTEFATLELRRENGGIMLFGKQPQGYAAAIKARCTPQQLLEYGW